MLDEANADSTVGLQQSMTIAKWNLNCRVGLQRSDKVQGG